MLQFKPLGTMCSNSNQVNSEQLKVSLQSKTGQTKLANKWLIMVEIHLGTTICIICICFSDNRVLHFN